MPSVLAVGALSLEACRKKVANFLADEDGPVRVVEVCLFSLDGVRAIGINEWQPREDEDLGKIAEQIASYIVKHQGAAATVIVRHDG